MFELTVKNSPSLLEKLAIFAKSSAQNQANLFVFTQGLYETTIITSNSLRPKLNELLKSEIISQTIPDLVGITLQRSPGHIERTGVLYYPLRVLAWKEISVIEIVTTMNDIMLVVREFEVDRAIGAIRKALKDIK